MTAVLAAVGLILAGLLAAAVLIMRRDPDLHIWPSVTRCRICERRVFVWQAKEFRPYVVRVENPDRLPGIFLPKLSASGIVHRGCRGRPAVSVTIRRRTALN